MDTINAMNTINSMSSIKRHDSDTVDNGQTELDELLDDMTRAREGGGEDVAIWKRYARHQNRTRRRVYDVSRLRL